MCSSLAFMEWGNGTESLRVGRHRRCFARGGQEMFSGFNSNDTIVQRSVLSEFLEKYQNEEFVAFLFGRTDSKSGQALILA